MRKRAAAFAAVASLLVLSASAQAAPGWTPAVELRDATHQWDLGALGFAADGLQFGGRTDVNSASPLNLTLGVAARRPGGQFADDFTVPTATSIPFGFDLAVAPDGAAVVGWTELPSTYPAGPVAYYARYRTPAGVWEPKVLLASDTVFDGNIAAGVKVAIGDDGTAAAGAVHLEPDAPGETLTDARADVLVHSPTGTWGPATRMNGTNRSALELELGVDAAGNVTAVWLERIDESDPQLVTRNTVVAKHRSPATGLWKNDGAIAAIGAGQSAVHVSFDVASSGRAVIAYGLDSLSDRDTFVTRRFAADAEFNAPVRAVPQPGAAGSHPIGVGVAGDGTYYVVIAKPVPDEFLVVRTSGGGPFSAPKPIFAGAGQPRNAEIAFDGNDAFIAADTASLTPVIKVTSWRSGAADPDPAHDLDAGQPVDALTQLVSDRNGSIVAVWNDTGFHSRLAVHDGGAPRLVEADVPEAGARGTQLQFRATFADAWSPLAPTSWDFGDGTTATGETVTHTYAAAGAYAVVAHGRDTLGNERTQAFAVTVTEPAITQPGSGPEPAAGGRAAADTIKPTVTLALPICKPGRSKRSCWRTLRGTAGDAAPSAGLARVEIRATRRGDRKPVQRVATVRGGRWTVTLPKLAKGRWTFRAQAYDASANVSLPAQRTARLR